MMIAQPSLYERLGGRDAVVQVVARLYERILGDDLLIPYFESINVERLRLSQTAFVTMAFGGPHDYDGPTMRKAHARLVERGLTDIHFDAVAGHLKGAMQEMGVPEAYIQEALALVETTRHDVLNR